MSTSHSKQRKRLLRMRTGIKGWRGFAAWDDNDNDRQRNRDAGLADHRFSIVPSYTRFDFR